METLKDKMIEVLNNTEENAIHFGGNLECGIEEFIGAYLDGDDVMLVTKEDDDMPLYYVEEEIDAEIADDLLDVINSNEFEVVDIDKLTDYTIG